MLGRWFRSTWLGAWLRTTPATTRLTVAGIVTFSILAAAICAVIAYGIYQNAFNHLL